MPIAERTERGLEARLRPRGAGRFFGAAFLAFWLCGWLAGECFALWFLVRGAIALITGQPVEPGRQPIELAPAIMVGAFLLLWLSLWSLGGVLAIAELLRLLWAEDRIVAGAGELSIEHRLGPFRSRRMIPQGDLRDIRLVRRTSRMVAETARASVELSRLGTPGEREELVPVLRRELGIEQRSEASADLPEGWQEVITPEGGPALVRDPGTQAAQARVAAILAFAALGVTALLAREATRNLSVLPGCLIAGALSFALAWGAVWLARGRVEWRIESGRIVQQRRFGARLNETFRAARLDLSVTKDSDGDEWFDLAALADPGESPAPATGLAATVASRKGRRSLLRVMNDDGTPRRLGAWLSRRTGLPFDDRSTQTAVVADLAALRAQLESSGRLGQLASRFIDRLEKRAR